MKSIDPRTRSSSLRCFAIRSRRALPYLLATLTLLTGVQRIVAQGTAFVFQGALNNTNAPANGNFDFVFALYDDPLRGSEIAPAETNLDVTVSDGLFTTTLDFGAAPWDGQALWLQILVRTNGNGAFTRLKVRQTITSTPYAIQALNAATAAIASSANSVAATNLSGTIPNSALPASPVFSGTVAAISFSGNGGGLTSLNPAKLAAGTAAINISGTAATAMTAAHLTGSIADSQLPRNVPLLDGTNFFTGTNAFAGVTIATNVNNSFVGNVTGNGSGLINLNPAGLSAGTAAINISGTAATAMTAAHLTGGIADSQLPKNVPLLDGTNSFTGSNTFAGVTIATNVNNSFSGNVTGNGSGLTNLNPLNLTPGTAAINISGNAATATTASNLTGNVADSQLPADVSLLDGTNSFTGTNAFAGVTIATNINNIFAGAFAGNVTGDGSGLTNLNPASLAAGTAAINISGNAATATTASNLTGNVADSQLPANVTLLNGTNFFTGTDAFAGVTIATNINNIFAGELSGDGSGLTNLNPASLIAGAASINISGNAATATTASNVTGNIADFQLSTNVAFLDGTNSFTGTNSFAGVTSATNTNNLFVGTFMGILSGNGSGVTNVSAATLDGTITAGSFAALSNSLSAETNRAQMAEFTLSTNMAQLNGTNSFAGTNTFAGAVVATNTNNVLTGTFTGSLIGNAATATSATSATTAGTATNFSGSLSGDVTGPQGATTVASVGGQAAANVASGASAANAATSTNTPGTIVMRDASGNFAAGAIMAGAFSGDGGAVTDLNPANLSAGTAGINISGNAATATTASNVTGEIADFQLSTNVAFLDGTNMFTGTNAFAGIIMATNAGNHLSGDAFGLTNLVPAHMAPGTAGINITGNAATATTAASANSVAAANLTGTILNSSLPASPVFSGAVTAESFSGDGGGLANLTPSNLVAGTAAINISGVAATALTSSNVTGNIPDSQLSTNVAFMSGTNLFSGTNNFAGVTVATNVNNIFTGAFAGNLTGNAATATSATSATSSITAVNFTGSLLGEVVGTQSATTVVNVGGQSAANIASGASAANAATSANTPSTIVKRDASGNFSAGTITAAAFNGSNLFTSTLGIAPSVINAAPEATLLTTTATYSTNFSCLARVVTTVANSAVAYTCIFSNPWPFTIGDGTNAACEMNFKVNGIGTNSFWSTAQWGHYVMSNSPAVGQGVRPGLNVSNNPTCVDVNYPTNFEAFCNATGFAVYAIGQITNACVYTTTAQLDFYEGQ